MTIDGNLESSGTGVRVRDDSSETYYKMSEEEIASMQDNFQLTDEWEYEDEEGKQHSGQHYRYVDENGNEYWEARELQQILDYSKWENFNKVIRKAKDACNNSSIKETEHFPEVRKPIIGGNGNEQFVLDYKLSRYACYLIA